MMEQAINVPKHVRGQIVSGCFFIMTEVGKAVRLKHIDHQLLHTQNNQEIFFLFIAISI